MERMVNDMSLLAQSEQPDFLQLQTIAIASFTEELFTKATALAHRDRRLVKGQNGQMVGDRQQLTGAALNLAQNAVQHTLETDCIELGAESTETEVRFWVRDTGEGIALEHQQ